MSALVNVIVHESRFPEKLQEELKHSLRTRQIAHTLHYQTHQQAEKWHALHLTHAPVNTDPSYAAIYQSAYACVAKLLGPEPLQVIGLCCGYAEKETRLLYELQAHPQMGFVASDTSLAMLLHAAAQAGKVLGAENCRRLLFDFQTASDLPECLDSLLGIADRRLFTLFGAVPNFEPEMIFSRLARLVRPGDLLLLSANLTPGPHYEASLREIMRQYNNPLTTAWLSQFILDVGLSERDGNLRVAIEPSPAAQDLHRIIIYFDVLRPCSVISAGERFEFHPGEALRLFYSYRYTPQLVHNWLAINSISVTHEWVSQSGEEGVFICAR